MHTYINGMQEFLNKDTYKFRAEQLDILIEFMLHNIGNTNPEIRDHLIYNSFVKLILEDHLTVQQMEYLIETCLSKQYLFLNIEDGTKRDSVFTRTFSALVLAVILHKDATDRRLSAELVSRVIQASIKYLLSERDYRGYIQGKGWAHSVAHGSDLLANGILHPVFDKNDITACLRAVRECIWVEYAYIDDEDERLIQVIEALIEQGMKDMELRDWVESLQTEHKNAHTKYRIEWNVKRFNYSLYMALSKHKGFSVSRQAISDQYLYDQ
ncbi:membrane protein [Virgibacillus pantothenticus]|uniref:DUF2785 domain-containing protein n=1 Tax=Virgibacillus TaxID=84406 RepID=UPI00067D58B6|nr:MULTISPECIES: DUF2785 domain-containing protein [Virgibacillus]API92489.1 hypothetical protein BKP57_12110 [Virgibacillus sp. 6R]MBS7427960.1 DUF2785 domain-containing protein [Virgibacillus sp. 19R1-5]MBU8568213.1 DUF2785 domain-containing protein [Virgibacillus pantothenticus]MBU8601861.1 DUF2785 domain-containing protein [Virgibacillus pantothenticus]MBU8636046.1 DUF2785 domain-containing protein [Virgibacillus pantothenticus]